MMCTNSTRIPDAPDSPPAPSHIPSGFKTSKPTFEPVRVHFAINNGDRKRVNDLIKKGYDLNYIIHGNTPLTLAILRDYFDIAAVLIDNGCDVNIPEKTKWKRLPLHLVACGGDLQVLKKILDKGCDINATDMTQMTALHWASLNNKRDIVQYLISSGANIHLKDDAGRTSLHRAAERGNQEIICDLVSAGSNINAQDKRGWSALFQPVACNDMEMVNLLLSFGADPNLQSTKGNTVLHVIADRLRGENVLILCRTDTNYYTRHLAVVNKAVQMAQNNLGRDLDIANLIIDYGGKADIKNYQDESCAFIAAKGGNGAIIKLLYDAGANLIHETWVKECAWPEAIQNSKDICNWLKNDVDAFRSLQQLCKIEIRQAIGKQINVNCLKLPLPKKLQTFLKVCY